MWNRPMIATLAAPLGAATPEAALALYDLARTSGASSAYEAAAHALARALQRQVILGATLRRPAPLSAPMGAPSEPMAKAPSKARVARLKQVEDDLAAIFARPSRANAATGSFWCVWSDGTATRVCGVVYHAGKPKTRWSAALRAGDTLRRLRARHAYALQLHAMAGGQSAALQVRTSCGVMVDSPDWQRLAMVRPMPGLAAIFDECSGETFTPPPGDHYGAGNAEEAAALEAKLVPPRLFWRVAEISAQGGQIFGAKQNGAGIAYQVASDGPLLVADGGPAVLTAWRADAREAFALAMEPAPKATAQAGERPPQHLSDLDGLAVVIAAPSLSAAVADALAAWNDARAPLETLREVMQETREAAQRANATPDDARAYEEANAAFSAALSIEKAAERRIVAARDMGGAVQRFATNEAGDLIRWTARRLAGGKAFRLTASDGACVTFDAERVKALRLAA